MYVIPVSLNNPYTDVALPLDAAYSPTSPAYSCVHKLSSSLASDSSFHNCMYLLHTFSHRRPTSPAYSCVARHARTYVFVCMRADVRFFAFPWSPRLDRRARRTGAFAAQFAPSRGALALTCAHCARPLLCFVCPRSPTSPGAYCAFRPVPVVFVLTSVVCCAVSALLSVLSHLAWCACALTSQGVSLLLSCMFLTYACVLRSLLVRTFHLHRLRLSHVLIYLAGMRLTLRPRLTVRLLPRTVRRRLVRPRANTLCTCRCAAPDDLAAARFSAAYSPTSPAYSPTSPAYRCGVAAWLVSETLCARPMDHHSRSRRARSPTSPSYSPASPSYSPSSPMFSPTDGGAARGSGSVPPQP